MTISSIRARMTLGLTLFVAALTVVSSAALWLRSRAEAEQQARALLQSTTAQVREGVARGANWDELADLVRAQNYATSWGEIELWRINRAGQGLDHARAPNPNPDQPAPPQQPLPPEQTAPPDQAAPRPPADTGFALHDGTPGVAPDGLAGSRVPPLADPGGWLSQRVTAGESTLLIAVPWHKAQRALDNQALALLLLGLLMSGAAGLGGWVLVGRTLSPIVRLAGQARERATAGRAAGDAALHLSSPDREVRELVSTFNALLASVAQSAQSRERFHASAAHELRTPLQALSGTLQLALSRSRTPEELRAALGDALAQTERLSTLTRDLLALNQLEAGTSHPPRESFDLAETCDLTLSSLQNALAARALRLSEDLRLAEVSATAWHMETLCRNLIENAVKYAPPGGALRVTTSTTAGTPVLRVWNATPARLAGEVSAWFEPFYRPDEARSSQTGGNGLGLALCAAVCHTNGWQLTLEQTSDDGQTGILAQVVFVSHSAPDL